MTATASQVCRPDRFLRLSMTVTLYDLPVCTRWLVPSSGVSRSLHRALAHVQQRSCPHRSVNSSRWPYNHKEMLIKYATM